MKRFNSNEIVALLVTGSILLSFNRYLFTFIQVPFGKVIYWSDFLTVYKIIVPEILGWIFIMLSVYSIFMSYKQKS